MEKSEFRVLIKHYFLRGKSIKEAEKSSQNAMRSLLHRMARFISGSLNFVVAVLAQVMPSVLAVHKR